MNKTEELERLIGGDEYERGRAIGYLEAKLQFCVPGAQSGATVPEFPKPVKVIVNPPATVILWEDGTKTVVKCPNEVKFDWEAGILYAMLKKAIGNSRAFHDILDRGFEHVEMYSYDNGIHG